MNLKPTSCQLGIRVPKEIQKPFTTKAAGQITVIGFLIESVCFINNFGTGKKDIKYKKH